MSYIKKELKRYKVFVKIGKQTKYFFVNSVYENSLKNLLACITILYILNDINFLNPFSFYNNKIPEGRGDISKIKFKNKYIFLIDESYNSNPLSLESAIKNFDLIIKKFFLIVFNIISFRLYIFLYTCYYFSSE